MTDKFEMRTDYKIYNNDTGEFIRVSEDDNARLVQIVGEGGSIVLVTVEQAELMLYALSNVIKDIKEKQRGY